MQVRNGITPAILTAATSMLQPYAPELSPKNLVQALKAYDNAGAAQKTDKPLTRQEAAELLSISLNSVSRYMREGRLRKIQLGKRAVRIDRASIQELLGNAELAEA